MADVFISYHEASAGEIVRQIAAALENVNVSCWYAERDLQPGAFAGAILNAICNCKVYLLVLSEKSKESQHVKNEIGIAFRRLRDGEQIILLPFSVDGCKLSYRDEVYYYLNRFQIIDGNPPDWQHIQKLVEQVSKVIPSKVKKSQPPLSPKTTNFINEPKLHQKHMPLQELQLSAEIVESGYCGESVIYTLNKNGILTISGNGKMGDCDSDIATFWQVKREMVRCVDIKSGVTFIGRGVFQNCQNLTRIIISDSVISIGDYAFSGCTGLRSVVIPDGVTYLGHGIFAYCHNLVSVTLSNNLKQVEAESFDHCFNLTNIKIPDSVTYIGSYAFNACESLGTVNIPNSVTYINSHAFSDCLSLVISLPAHATIANDAFQYTDVTIMPHSI